MIRTEPSNGARLSFQPSILAAAFRWLLARLAAVLAKQWWYVPVFTANPDTAVVPPVLTALSATVPAWPVLCAFAAADAAALLPVDTAAGPTAGHCSTAVVASDADTAAFAGAVQPLARSTIFRWAVSAVDTYQPVFAPIADAAHWLADRRPVLRRPRTVR